MLSTTLYQMSAIILLAAQIIHVETSSSLNLIEHSHVQDLSNIETSCCDSFWCPKFNFVINRINLYLQDWINYIISDFDIYDLSVHIAGASVDSRLPPFPRFGTTGYCVYTAGEDLSAADINGSIKQKMKELRVYGCFARESVSIADDDNPVAKGLFKID